MADGRGALSSRGQLSMVSNPTVLHGDEHDHVWSAVALASMCTLLLAADGLSAAPLGDGRLSRSNALPADASRLRSLVT